MRWLVSTLIAALVTAIVLILAWDIAPWPSVVAALAASEPLPLIGAALFVVPIQWFRAWRFSILLHGSVRAPAGSLMRVTLLAVVLNVLLPFRLGEFGFPLLMRRHQGTPLLRGAGILALVRLWDLALVSTAAAVLILLMRPATAEGKTVAVAGFAIVAGLLTVRLPWWCRRIIAAIRTATRHVPRLDAMADRLASGLESLDAPGSVTAVLVATSGIWLLHGAIGIAVVSSGAVPIDPLLVALATLAGTLAFALPINGIAAVGPTHAAWTATLTLGGVPLDHAVATGILWHALLVTTSMVLGSFAALWPERR